MSMTSFWNVFLVKLEHITYLFLVFTVDFEQLNAAEIELLMWNCSENCLKRTLIRPKQGVCFRRCTL